MISVNLDRKAQEHRTVFMETLAELIEEDSRTIVLESDLGGASYLTKLQKYPDNFINVGVAEANMIGVAVGLNLRGRIPYVHSFSPFVTRRCYDQLFVSAAYAHNTIKIYGSDPGVCATANGGTHTSFEDIAMMRAIPNTQILDPSDEYCLKSMIKQTHDSSAITYIRTSRKALSSFYLEDQVFELGKAIKLLDGQDILLLSMGEVMADTYKAALELQKLNIYSSVLDMFSVKPIDSEAIIKESQNKKLVVTIENHSINGGLGSIVAEILSEHQLCVPLLRLGVNEEFGEVGSLDYLKKRYGIDKDSIVSQIKERVSK